jgi:hypothetical protein
LSPRDAVPLAYSERSAVRVRGSVTGQTYAFSGDRPVQLVDRRDAPALVATPYFQRTV